MYCLTNIDDDDNYEALLGIAHQTSAVRDGRENYDEEY